jgi:hypothetical protein
MKPEIINKIKALIEAAKRDAAGKEPTREQAAVIELLESKPSGWKFDTMKACAGFTGTPQTIPTRVWKTLFHFLSFAISSSQMRCAVGSSTNASSAGATGTMAGSG